MTIIAILELAPEHLGALISGESVTIGNMLVRQGAGVLLTGTGDLAARSSAPVPANEEEAIAARVAARRTDSRQKLTGEPQFWMNAKFDGTCPTRGCGAPIARGHRVLRDAQGGGTYCVLCGESRFPNVRDTRRVHA